MIYCQNIGVQPILRNSLQVHQKGGLGGVPGKGGIPGRGGQNHEKCGIFPYFNKGGGSDGRLGTSGDSGDGNDGGTLMFKDSHCLENTDLKGTGDEVETQYKIDSDFTLGAKYYAIIFSCSNYIQAPEKKLNFPIQYGEELKEILPKKYRFEKPIFKEDPTRKDIFDTLNRYSKILETNDNLFIFFSGHGQFIKEKSEGYWLVSDASWTSESNWISNSDINTLVNSFKCNHLLLFSDACFSGSLVLENAKGEDDKNIYSYRSLYDLSSRTAITTGSLTTVPDKSRFVEQFFMLLQKNRNKYLSADDVFVEAKKESMEDPKNPVPQYLPFRTSKHAGGDFIFVIRD